MNRGHTLEEYDYIIRTLQEQEKIGDTYSGKLKVDKRGNYIDN